MALVVPAGTARPPRAAVGGRCIGPGLMVSADHPGVEVLDWAESAPPRRTQTRNPPDPRPMWIEAGRLRGLSLHSPASFVSPPAPRAGQSRQEPGGWINLSTSPAGMPWRCHGLTSPVMHGPAAGMSKRFLPRLHRWHRRPAARGRPAGQPGQTRPRSLAGQGHDWAGERLVSLFCCEPPALPAPAGHIRPAAASHCEPGCWSRMAGRRPPCARLLAKPTWLRESCASIGWHR